MNKSATTATSNIFVSVLMPVYNSGSYLKEAIESILNQTYTNFEFIILNDGSTDNSKEIILSYNDPRIRYYENETNLKLVETLNKGWDLCNGKYIVRMDADDISFPQRIKKQVAYMEAHPEIGIAGSAVYSFGFTEGEYQYETDPQLVRYKFLLDCHLLHPTAIIRTEVMRKHGLKMTILYGEDYDLFLRIAEHSEIANMKDVLLQYRQTKNSMSKANSGITYDHSNQIRLGLFRKLDSSFQLEDILLYEKLAYQNYSYLTERINAVEALILKMLSANSRTGIYPKDSFSKYIADMWFAFLSYKPVTKEKFSKMLFSDVNKFSSSGLIYKLKVATKLILAK